MNPANPLAHVLVMDTETSGPVPGRDAVLALAIVPAVAHASVGEFSVYIKPHPTPEFDPVARRFFQKYEDKWMRHGVSLASAMDQLSDYLEKLPTGTWMLAGHNIGFDAAFFKPLLPLLRPEASARLSHRMIDTHTLLQCLSWQGLIAPEDCGSERALHRFEVSPPPELRHTALGDALATRELLAKLVPYFQTDSSGARAGHFASQYTVTSAPRLTLVKEPLAGPS